MNQDELIKKWIEENRPEVVAKTDFTQSRVSLIKELLEDPPEKKYRLINFELHYIDRKLDEL
jgi:hypothetical protein